ncbi:MAG: enoyl-CoA hydratase/isomerase family protein [Deltaproteobacteria bacterium]|nr:enoyl-CoA hydratase/isomerase family protein [Deltaproteobacteria bacterium]
MTEENVLLVERHGNVERWTLNRPGALNAFNKPLLLAINAELDALPDRSDVRAVVVCGAGGRALSAGADLKERKTMPPEDVPAFVNLIGSTFNRVAQAAVPFIAAVDGFAFGGGMEMALACDIRVFGAGAKVGLTETRLAIIPGAGGTQRLPRLVGVGRAKELILSGRRIGAEEAFRIGLAEFLTEAGGAVEKAHAVANEIASCGPVAVRAAKAAIDGGLDRSVEAGLAWERACYDRTLPTTDRLEALAAFAEKRPPVFEGR